MAGQVGVAVTQTEPMKALWVGTEGGSVLHGCYPKSDAEDLAMRFATAHLVHPEGVNNGCVVGPCCMSCDMPCQSTYRGSTDERMAAVMDFSLAKAEGRSEDAVWAAVRIATIPGRCAV